MPGDHPDELFAEALMQMGAVTFEQLEAARAVQSEHDPSLPLAEILVQRSIITPQMRENVEKKLRAQKAGGIRKLGPYELKKKLGEGGMGVVYLAEDTQLGRPCAVKVLSREYGANREFISRFRREAMAAGKLNHPNIVLAYTVGEELGIHYYAMEFCEGQPLDRVLKCKGVLPWKLATEVVIQVGRGLQHAHEHAIIHRDIKPSNIFICRPAGMPESAGEVDPFPQGFVAKILDLGLSKSIGGGADASFLTHTGVTLGTPHYISPEQANGDRDIDGRTDIYSLGATYYHLVTGRTPFVGASAAAIILKHLREPLLNPKDLNPSLPPGVIAVIQRMLAKAPADRHPTCKDVVQDLEGILAGQMPVIDVTGVFGTLAAASVDATVPVATIPLSTEQATNRRLLLGVVLAAGLLIAGVLAGAMLLFRRPGPDPIGNQQAQAQVPVQAQKKQAVADARGSEAATQPDEQAKLAAEDARLAREAEQGAKLSALEEQLLRERQQTEETKRQLAEAKRQIEETKRQPGPVELVSRLPADEPPEVDPQTEKIHQIAEKTEPGDADDPPRRPPPPEQHRTGGEILADLDHWVQRVLQEDQPSEPPALPELVWVDDVEGLKRLYLEVARKTLDAEDAQRRAQDNETAARNRIGVLQRRMNTPDRPSLPEPRNQPGRPPVRPPPPQPDDRFRRERDGDAQQLNTLNAQARDAREEADRVGMVLRALGGAKQAITFRLRKLGVDDPVAADPSSRKDAAYKIYVLRDGRELKAYMAVKMGDRIAIKDEEGEMHTLNTSDIKEIRSK